MKRTKNIKDLLQDYRVPVTETEWQIIINNPKVTRYNAIRHALNIIKYPAILLLGIAVIVAVFVVMPHVHRTQTPPDPNKTPTQITQPNVSASTVDSATTHSTTVRKSNEKIPSVSSLSPVTPATPVDNTSPAVPNEQTSVAATASSNQTQTATPAPVEAPHSQPADLSQTSHFSAPLPATTIAKDTDFIENVENLSFSPPPPDEQAQAFDNQLFIPGAFTPNGDGLNDKFIVKANFQPASFAMTIFNKDGQKVFNTRNMEIGWDGQHRGHSVPQDLYFYIIKYTAPDGTIKVEKGQLLLIK